MPPNCYRKLGVLAILSLGSVESMAQGMPALRVDPTLLGQTPAAKEQPAPAASAPPATGTGSAVVTPVRSDEVPATRTAASAASATSASPTSAPTSAAASTAASKSAPAAPRPATQPTPTAAAVAIPPVSSTQKLPSLRVDPALLGTPSGARPAGIPTQVAVTGQGGRPCVPVAAPVIAAAPGPTTPTSPTAPTNKLPLLRVDPSLLGAAPTAPVAIVAAVAPSPAPAMVIDCPDGPTQLAAAPGTAGASRHAKRGVPLSTLPATMSRLPVGNLEETTIVADTIRGNNDTEVIAEGNVELNKDNILLEADYLAYRQPLDEVEASGNVRLSRDIEEMVGPYAKIQLKAKTGYFDQPAYVIQRSVIGGEKKKSKQLFDLFSLPEPPPKPPVPVRGNASRLHFEGENQYRMDDASFSTCTPNTDGSLDWYTKVSDLKLDYTEGRGVGRNTTVYFKGAPILYTPYIDFPLNNERKSGLLIPSIGTSSKSGVEYTQPYYWNIAPDMDATIAGHVMSKRGVQLQSEFRYLQPTYSGQVHADYLPQDSEYGKSRYAYALNHIQNFGYGFGGTLTLNRVSDDDYFKDLNNKLGINSQTLLLNQGVLTYGANWWNASLMLQDYQVLKSTDPKLVVAEPYALVPKLSINAVRADLPGDLQFNFLGESASFRHSTLQTGMRNTLYPQISLPLQTSAFFITPKIGYHFTSYSLDSLNRNGVTIAEGSSPNRGVPIATVDTGTYLERDTQWFGRPMTQTLEPRLYYVYVPYRDQATIPLFDTGVPDFNFAQIFSENRYVGGDRIGDANQLTGMVSSRFIEPETGAELMRVGVGQRVYFSQYKVTLPGENPSRTDLLAAFSGQVLPRVYVDTAWQYSQDTSRTERYNIGMRYQPEIGKVLNAGYRFVQPTLANNLVVPGTGLDQIDLSAQWPIGKGWYGVGRYNYSIQSGDKKLIEAIAGLEYDAGCWIVRGVFQRSVTVENDYNSSFFVQLELKDFSRIGSDPMGLLKRSVGGYRNINTMGSDPTFATQ